MNFPKRLLVVWAIVGPGLAFLLGPGFLWEWRKSDIESGRLDIERARVSLEIREKMNATLQEIINLGPSASAVRKSKVDYFNAAEKNLARIEQRSPIVYTLNPPNKVEGLTIK